MEEEDARDDHAETVEHADDVGRRHRAPVFEEDRRRHEHAGREEDVVDRCDDGGVEDIERLVEVVHLDGDENAHEDEQDPRDGFGEGVDAVEELDKGDADALAGHDGQRADDGTDEDVDKHVGVAPSEAR